jgi:hypothetical protein
MGGTNAQLLIGQQVSLPGHFALPVTLEAAHPVAQGYECQVRLPDGTLEQITISLDEATTLAAQPEKAKPHNQDAIKKTATGLLKLLHPHRTPDSLVSDEIQPLMEVAVEMRQRVTDQLAKILPTEFTNVPFVFKLTRQNPVADASPSPATSTNQTPR